MHSHRTGSDVRVTQSSQHKTEEEVEWRVFPSQSYLSKRSYCSRIHDFCALNKKGLHIITVDAVILWYVAMIDCSTTVGVWVCVCILTMRPIDHMQQPVIKIYYIYIIYYLNIFKDDALSSALWNLLCLAAWWKTLGKPKNREWCSTECRALVADVEVLEVSGFHFQSKDQPLWS